MTLGLMNNPQRTVEKEIARIAELGFDFVDLTLEPPQAMPQKMNLSGVRALLNEKRLGVVGHTAYYLPFASAYDKIHRAAIEEAAECIAALAGVGAACMNLHLDCKVPNHDPDFINNRNIGAIAALLPHAERHGITLMIENVEGDTAETLAPIFAALPAVGLHLDIGHANIGTKKSHAAGLLERFGDRLCHVHLSDNKGKSDDHLAIGAGVIPWKREIKTLKASGYDGTITLETFYGDSDLILYSRDKVRALWQGVSP